MIRIHSKFKEFQYLTPAKIAAALNNDENATCNCTAINPPEDKPDTVISDTLYRCKVEYAPHVTEYKQNTTNRTCTNIPTEQSSS